MPGKCLYMHVGMPKSGSTSIQTSLFQNPDACQAADVFYPRLNWNHSKPILSMFGDDTKTFITAYGNRYHYPISASDLDSIRSRFLREIKDSDCSTHVISGESLQRMTPERCRALREMLAPLYDRIRILAYVRHPFGWASSRAQFSLKRYARPIASMFDPEMLRSMESPAIPKYSRLETFIKEFGVENVDIRIFDRQHFVGGDLLQDFGTAIGKPDLGRGLCGAWTNVAYSSEAVAILDRYVSRTPRLIMGRFESIRTSLEELPGSKYSLPRRDLAKIWTHSQPQVEWLHRAIGRECFHEVYPAEADRGAVWSDETVDHLERRLGIRWKNVCDRNGTVGPRGLDLLCDGFERLAPDARQKSLLNRAGSVGLIGALRYMRSAGYRLVR